MGWVMTAAGVTSFGIRLLRHMVARVGSINQGLMCVNSQAEGNPGFVLPLPVELPPLDWSLPVRVVAVSVDASAQAELPLMTKKSNTAERLRALLQSDCLGMDGHVDGVQGEKLVGWAGRPGQHQPATIVKPRPRRSELLRRLAKVWPTNRCLISAVFSCV